METNLQVQEKKINPGLNFFDPEQFDTIQRVCKMFATSELVPDMYKESGSNPLNKAMSNCMIALDVANRIGAAPLMVMQNLVIIYGRPSWSSKFLIATVNTCGRFEPLKYSFTNKGMLGKVEYTDYVWNQSTKRKEAVTKVFDGTKIANIECKAYTVAKGSDEVLESSIISLEMAIKEGWYTKSGSKWRTMPQQMLMYRAASFWTSAYAPELSMGMKTSDEVMDIVDADYIDVSDEVELEKASKANKESVAFGSTPADASTSSTSQNTSTTSMDEPKDKDNKKEASTDGNLFKDGEASQAGPSF